MALVKLNAVNAALFPTVEEKAATPAVPARMVRAFAPLTVLANVMLAPAALPPLFVVSNVTAPVTLTGPFKRIGKSAVRIMLAKLMAVEPL